MSLYLGGNKVNVNLADTLYKVNLLLATLPTADSFSLLSSDGFVLKDSEGFYLTIKEHT